MSNRNSRRGFSKTHQTCPCPRQEQKCFSTFADDPGSGYCFACAQVIQGSRKVQYFPSTEVRRTETQQQVFVPHDVVTESMWPVLNLVSTFGNIEGHREAITGYAELRAEGLDHTKAFQLSGYRAISRSRLPEIRHLINELPSFFRQLIYQTVVPDILNGYHIGLTQLGEVVFWIVDSNGRVCNGQAVPYDGLSRSVNRQTRFIHRSAEGYVVSSFFGAEQLQSGAVSWIQQPFAPFALVVIVESPKSALLASLLYPEAIWLASCGTSGVTPAKARALRGREVCILFDNDRAGHDGAQRAIRVLLEAGAFPRIVEPEVFFGGSRPEGWDVGDEALKIIGGQE